MAYRKQRTLHHRAIMNILNSEFNRVGCVHIVDRIVRPFSPIRLPGRKEKRRKKGAQKERFNYSGAQAAKLLSQSLERVTEWAWEHPNGKSDIIPRFCWSV